MPDEKTLKQRIHDGDVVNIVGASVNMTREKLEEMLGKDTVDLVGVDIQHSPCNEERIVEFCKMANEMGVPVQLLPPCWSGSHHLR